MVSPQDHHQDGNGDRKMLMSILIKHFATMPIDCRKKLVHSPWFKLLKVSFLSQKWTGKGGAVTCFNLWNVMSTGKVSSKWIWVCRGWRKETLVVPNLMQLQKKFLSPNPALGKHLGGLQWLYCIEISESTNPATADFSTLEGLFFSRK